MKCLNCGLQHAFPGMNVCITCADLISRAEDDGAAGEEWAAIQRGDAAPEEVETARRQMGIVRVRTANSLEELDSKPIYDSGWRRVE